MRRRFTESQLVSGLKKQEGGIAVNEISHELGISEATLI
jgi:putative transposase